MSEVKTKVNDESVESFINSIVDEVKKQDCFNLLEIFSKATSEMPKMWGASIIGFGQYHYKSEQSSQEGDWPLVAFSPRKQNLSLYLTTNGYDEYALLLNKLGKHKIGKACLYINKLSDIDSSILADLISETYNDADQLLNHNQL